MDYEKIGKFIMNERKTKNYTQAKLAEKLFVSEKNSFKVGKWKWRARYKHITKIV